MSDTLTVVADRNFSTLQDQDDVMENFPDHFQPKSGKKNRYQTSNLRINKTLVLQQCTTKCGKVWQSVAVLVIELLEDAAFNTSAYGRNKDLW